MHPKYPTIFSPFKIGPIEIPNRFYFAPHGNQMTAGTKPSRDYAYYMAERVRDGGCGLVVSAFTAHERNRQFQSTAYPKDNVPSLRAMAEAVHEAGAKIFAEVWYFWGTAGTWQPNGPAAPSMSPSANQYRRGTRSISTHEMTKEEILALINAYRQTARNLREGGFDGIMVHAAHGALLEQFTSPYFNRRDDEYGGTQKKRMRVLTDVLRAAREEGGGNFAVGMRFNCDEMLHGGYGQNEAREILSAIHKEGLLDYADLDVAVEPNQYDLGMPPVFVKPQVYRPYVEAVRSVVPDLPILSVLGRLTTLEDAEAALKAGACDVVGAARGLIAEPQLVSNARAGKEAQSRVCIACNWCLAAPAEGGAQGCTINPASYRERQWGVRTLTPAARRSKVIVVGGGPAGLEAARVAAHRGHDVTLIEARAKLGGALELWASLPDREFIRKNIEWWERELRRLGVNIQCGTAATVASVLAEMPDAVIVATGALYSVGGHTYLDENDIPGYDKSFVYRPEDILLHGKRPKGKVVVLDAESINTSAGVAEVIARAGAKVHYLTPDITLLSQRLYENQESGFIMKRLYELDVQFSPCTAIKSIEDGRVIAFNVHTEKSTTIDGVDAVVLSTGRVPQNSLAKELEGKVAQLFTVGDALSARLLAGATYEGQKFARYIGEPDAPRTVGEAYFRPHDFDYASLPADVLLTK